MKFQPTDDQLSKAQQAAYRGGRFAATYWPEARKGMPDGATIGHYRIKCEAGLALSLSPDERVAFMKSFLGAFDEEIARRAALREPGFEDASEMLSAEVQQREQQVTETNAEARGYTGRH